MAKRKSVLIESDWNLKDVTVLTEPVIFVVLIESDWNLKFSRRCVRPGFFLVLIESDWNLKRSVAMTDIVNSCCINRIRLEFKGPKPEAFNKPCEGINRIRLEFKADGRAPIMELH